jgi:hypothetical protein
MGNKASSQVATETFPLTLQSILIPTDEHPKTVFNTLFDGLEDDFVNISSVEDVEIFNRNLRIAQSDVQTRGFYQYLISEINTIKMMFRLFKKATTEAEKAKYEEIISMWKKVMMEIINQSLCDQLEFPTEHLFDPTVFQTVCV